MRAVLSSGKGRTEYQGNCDVRYYHIFKKGEKLFLQRRKIIKT
jgi:hypothetical protein